MWVVSTGGTVRTQRALHGTWAAGLDAAAAPTPTHHRLLSGHHCFLAYLLTSLPLLERCRYLYYLHNKPPTSVLAFKVQMPTFHHMSLYHFGAAFDHCNENWTQ